MAANHSQLRELFVAACDLPEREQTQFIDEHCSGYPELKVELERLLASDAKSRGILSDGNTSTGVTFHLDTVAENGFPAQDRKGRYKLMGEIARGGVGAIIEGRDVELGRGIAIKVLLDEHKNSPQIVQRFLEEAQIAGQLQHPGIPPIYEVGQLPDRRPFISMKLVKGETLATLLSDRKPESDDRRKFLGIFEQICQTLAFAHSKGVIHRDLKPSNIMVGAFGEVQVMDWGLAKVLPADTEGRDAANDPSLPICNELIKTLRDSLGAQQDCSPTLTGAVMGTPAYMPPEQATGKIDQIDRRTDVFALGAILCEILTGKQIYYGYDNSQVLQAAKNADLIACFQRLDESNADTDLLNLAKSCLGVQQITRPQDASELACQLTAHLESVERRLREAEIDRAAQAAKADEERKRRRVTMALATTVLAAVVLGAIGWTILQKQRTDAMSATVSRINDSIGDAQLHQSLADAANSDANPDLNLQLRELKQGLDSAKYALKQTKSTNANDLLKNSVEALHAELKARTQLVQQQVEQASFDNAIQAQLELVRLSNGRGEGDWGQAVQLSGKPKPVNANIGTKRKVVLLQDLAQTPLMYARVFKKAGIDVYASNLNVAVNTIVESDLRESLIAALDHWARAISVSTTGKKAGGINRERLLEIADLADTSQWRKMLRSALASGKVETLREMATNKATQEQSSEMICWLGAALRNAGALEASITLLRPAQLESPGDFWLNYELGTSLAKSGQRQEGLGYLRAALSIRPKSLGTILEVGAHLQALKRYSEAERLNQQAVEIAPDYAIAHLNLGVDYYHQGQVDEAISRFEKAIELDPDFDLAHFNLATAFTEYKQKGKAVGVFKKAVELNNDSSATHHNFAVSLFEQGKTDEAIFEYKKAIELSPKNVDSRLGLSNCFFMKRDYGRVVMELKTAIKINPKFADLHANIGAAYAMMGNTKDELESLREAISLEPEHFRAHANLASSLKAMGQFKDATVHFRKALEIEPTDEKLLVSFSSLLKQHGHVGEAMSVLRSLVKVNPSQGRWHNHLAKALSENGETKSAIVEFSKAVELQPDDARFRMTLGMAYFQNEDWENALEALTQAKAVDQTTSVNRKLYFFESHNFMYLAMTHWKLGDQDQARAYYKQAKHITRNDPPNAKRKLLFKKAAELIGETSLNGNNTK